MLAFEVSPTDGRGPSLELAADVDGERTLAADGAFGRRQEPRCCGRSPGCCGPRRGRIALGGERLARHRRGVDLPPERRGIGFVFQDYALFPRMSALENVAFGAGRGLRARNAAGAARELLERLGLAARAEARPANLSGGERQRVALARALASRAAAAAPGRAALGARPAERAPRPRRELATVLAEARVPAVLVTHSFDEAAILGDEIAVVDGGRLIQRGTAAELAARPASGLVGDLAGASVLRGEAVGSRDGLTVVRLDGGQAELLATDPGAGPVDGQRLPLGGDAGAAGAPAPADSALNHLAGEIISVTEFGNRARVALATPQPFVAELTAASVARLGLRPGERATATLKATATRLSPRGRG